MTSFWLLGIVAVSTLVPDQSALAATPASLQCAAKGVELLKPRLTYDDVCNRFSTGISKALKIPVVRGVVPSSARAVPPHWIKVDLVFKKPGVAAAMVTQHVGGKTKTYPELSIAVFDRPMDVMTVDMLVREVGRILAAK
jgi:hypothetical protein